MRVLVAMSGGVDSALAAALIAEGGHEVVGATMKLWGGASDSGCCSVADVTDARRVCDDLGIDHRVFNFTEEFGRSVVDGFVEAHRVGRTPNPCVVCNTELKFGRFLERAGRLGFDAIATGHHARLRTTAAGDIALVRGADPGKDQSYVLAALDQEALSRLQLPIGELTKDQVRVEAARRGIRVADKPDSQDVCFIASRTPDAGRRRFLDERIDLHEGVLVDVGSGRPLGTTDAIELLTVGQRRGLGAGSGPERRYVVSVDLASRRVEVGRASDLLVEEVALSDRTWVGASLSEGSDVLVQVSAHGAPRAATLVGGGLKFATPERRVAPGQLVALYQGDAVVGSGIAA